MKKKPKPSDTILLLRRALRLARAEPSRSFVIITVGDSGITADGASAGRDKKIVAAAAHHASGKLMWDLGPVGSIRSDADLGWVFARRLAEAGKAFNRMPTKKRKF